MSKPKIPAGATSAEWVHFSEILGLTEAMLPITYPSKAPSLPGKNGAPVNQSWKRSRGTLDKINEWKADPRIAFGVRTNQIRAIDVDISDPKLAKAVHNTIDEFILLETEEDILPCRMRADSAKFLLVFQLDGDFPKRVLHIPSPTNEKIEVLGDGQQFVATGLHAAGKARYAWEPTLPPSIPHLTLEQFNALFARLQDVYGGTIAASRAGKRRNTSLTPAGDVITDPHLFQTDPIAAALREGGHVLLDRGDTLYIKCPNSQNHTMDGGIAETAYFLAGTRDYRNGHFYCLHGHCQSLDNTDFITAYNLSGFEDISPLSDVARIDMYLSRYVYVANGGNGDKVVDLTISDPQKWAVKTASFHTKQCFDTIAIEDNKKIKQIPISKIWISNKKRKTVQAIAYHPAQGQFYTEKGADFLNTYIAAAIKKTTATNLVPHFVAHMEHLLPIPMERDWFIQWMAFNVQFPHKRCQVAPLLIATETGTGRGWVRELITRLLGKANVSSATMDTLESGYTHYMHEKLLCCIEETYVVGQGKYKLLEKLKSAITDDRQAMNIKYGAAGTETIYVNFFFMSNHIDAAAVAQNDRRFNVFECTTCVLPRSYFITAYKHLDDDEYLGQIYHYLMGMDLSNFNSSRSFQTEMRRRMIDASKNETEQLFDDFINEPPTKAMTFSQICTFLRQDAVSLNETQLLKLLQKSDKCIAAKPIKAKKRKVRLWVFDFDIIDDTNALRDAYYSYTAEEFN